MFDYLGSILSYITIAFPILYASTYDGLSAPDLSALISKVSWQALFTINEYIQRDKTANAY